MSIGIERVDGVLHIRLERPERRNALDAAAVDELVGILERASMDDGLRAILLDSEGSNFCSGADWIGTNQSVGRPRTGSLRRRLPFQAHRVVELLTTIQLPVVCAVRGWAAGLGFQLALAADFTIAAEQARFWEPFITRGFSADSGATWFLPRLVGVARAKELLLLGRELSGREAAEWGLIMAAVADEDLDRTVREVVDRLAQAPTVAVGLTKQCLHQSLGGLVEAMDSEAQALELASRTSDFKEGMAAFRERRSPSFEGR